MGISELFQLTTRFHNGVVAVPMEFRAKHMKRYPVGSCGDASLLLGAYLVDQGVEGFLYICGKYGEHNGLTHAWLQRGNCVVDITASQFLDAPSPIVVASPSPWHSRFTPDQPTESDFRRCGANVVGQLDAMYGCVLEKLALQGGTSDG